MSEACAATNALVSRTVRALVGPYKRADQRRDRRAGGVALRRFGVFHAAVAAGESLRSPRTGALTRGELAGFLQGALFRALRGDRRRRGHELAERSARRKAFASARESEQFAQTQDCVLVREIAETTGKWPRLIHLRCHCARVASFCRRDPARRGRGGEGGGSRTYRLVHPDIVRSTVSYRNRGVPGTMRWTAGHCSAGRLGVPSTDLRWAAEKAREGTATVRWGGWTIARRCDRGRRRERAETRARRRSRRVHLAPRNAARVSR